MKIIISAVFFPYICRGVPATIIFIWKLSVKICWVNISCAFCVLYAFSSVKSAESQSKCGRQCFFCSQHMVAVLIFYIIYFIYWCSHFAGVFLVKIEYFIPAWSSFTYSLVWFQYLVLNILVSWNFYSYLFLCILIWNKFVFISARRCLKKYLSEQSHSNREQIYSYMKSSVLYWLQLFWKCLNQNCHDFICTDYVLSDSIMK